MASCDSSPQQQQVQQQQQKFDYDFIVIGGGSGGLSAAKTAALAGAKVAVFDFVDPTVHGIKWGLGGTCVNVGCIPKKLMHAGALLGEGFAHDMKAFGWKVNVQEKQLDWHHLVEKVNDHIRSINFAYRTDLRVSKSTFFNAKGRLAGPHTVEFQEKGNQRQITGRYILVAVGGRPKYPSIPGAELAITSDDIFQLDRAPGKTLVVGASYVALECAGFLTGFHYDTTTMIRSIPLRGFDQQMASKIVEYMEKFAGTKFIHSAVPTAIEKLVDGKLKVHYQQDGIDHPQSDVFDTVLMAVGRYALTQQLNLDSAGVFVNPTNAKILTNEFDQTNVLNIFAIGDCADGRPELTPVAVQAGKLLAERLFVQKPKLMDYRNVATTVFTPLEYGCVGFSEEDAEKHFGADNIEVYHMQASPYEQAIVEERGDFPAYVKIIVNLCDKERILGFHVLAPNAGEIIQGFAVALRFEMTSLQERFDKMPSSLITPHKKQQIGCHQRRS